MIFVMMPQAFYFHILFTAFQSPSSFRNPTLEAVKDFFDHVGHQTQLVEISIFSLNNVTVRITKIKNNLLKHLKILIFKVIFLVFKIGRIFPLKIF